MLRQRAVIAVVSPLIAGLGAAQVVAASDAPSAHATAVRYAASTVQTTPEPTTPATPVATPQARVRVGVATVWVRPGKARPVDAPALRKYPRVDYWRRSMSLPQLRGLGGRVETQILRGEPVVIIRQLGPWARIRIPRQTGGRFPFGIVGWVPRAQLTTRAHPAITRLHRAHHPLRPSTILRVARHYLGTPYLWGGMSTHGLDCSGLTYRVFARLGVLLPRDAADQATVGRAVRRRDLRPGDLVYFGVGSRTAIHHVGIYAGHGLVLHAPYSGTTVHYTPLSAWSDYWGARRIR